MLLWYMKNEESNFSKNEQYLLRIQYTFAQDKKYKMFHLNNNPKGWWIVSKSLRKIKLDSTCLLLCSLDTNKEIFMWDYWKVFCRKVFYQSSCVIYLK